MPTEWVASILVAVIAAFSAYASQRQASKASQSSDRMNFEKEAFNRARQFDTDTITRQKLEIEELIQERDDAVQKFKGLEKQLETALSEIKRLKGLLGL